MAAGGLAGCGSGREREGAEGAAAPAEVAPAVNPNAKPVDPATAGTISGIVKLDGTASDDAYNQHALRAELREDARNASDT